MTARSKSPDRTDKVPVKIVDKSLSKDPPQSRLSLQGLGHADRQHIAGNLAIQTMFQSRLIRQKLAISQPDDPDEREADRVADEIMRLPHSTTYDSAILQSNSQPTHVQRSCSAECVVGPPCYTCGDGRTRRKAVPNLRRSASDTVFSRSGVLGGGGDILPSPVRAFFEPRFGCDFSQVRIHRDASAAESAKAIQARAFTSGRDIVFGPGEYAPETAEGRKLIAHELTHVVQQGDATAQQSSTRGVGQLIASVGRNHVQRDWLDSAETAISGVLSSTKAAVSEAAETATSAIGSGAAELATDVAAVAATTVPESAKAPQPFVSAFDNPIGGIANRTRDALIARVNAVRQHVQDATVETTADLILIARVNRHISSLNSALPASTAVVPLVAPALGPVIGPAAGAGLGEILSGIGAVLVSATAAEVLLVAIIILAILALFLQIANGDDGKKEKAKEKDEKKRAKEREEEDRRNRERNEEEKEKRKGKDKDEDKSPCRKPFRWNPTTIVKKAVASQGSIGALELCLGAPSPPSGLQFDAHHVWPKFAGGPESQPLMGIFSFIHLSILHPTLLNPLLTSTFGITNRTTDSKNIAFIARLRLEPALRSQVAAVLTGFYASLNLQTEPSIPASAFVPGISSSFISLGL